jgi:hypothetical protein
MTRTQIETLFRRRVHDVEGIQWSAAEQHDLANLAYSKVQKEIVKVRADAFLHWDYINTAAGTNLYPLPATFGVRRVGYKASAADTAYAKLSPKGWEQLMDMGTSLTKPYYALPNDLWLGIWPAPSANVVAGIELVHTPILALAADDEVPRIKLPLHDAIALWMVIIAKGETDEDGALAKAELNNLLEDLPFWYTANTDEPDKFQIVGM